MVQYVNKSGFISGLQAGYDVLRSKTDLNNYYPIIITILYNINNPNNIPSYQNPVNVKGQTYLQDKDINISPYIGYRFRVKKIKIDVMPGAELGFNINSYDKGKATDSNGNTYQTNLKLGGAPTDIRLRFGIAASLNRFGLTASYSHGLTNLYKNTSGEYNYTVHSELIRFGLTYRIF